VTDASRNAIADAARRLFEERGFTGASIGDIAREAGVAVQTIYNTVGSKQDVLLLALDHTVAGERTPTPVPVFMAEQARAEPDPRKILDQLVAFWRDALPRSAPIQRVIDEAALVDESMAAFARERSARRLRNYGLAAEVLEERGALRPGLTREAAAACIFAIGHPQTFRTLVLDGGWSTKKWAAWVRDALEAALLCP
jgi:AcrR family transcriptional regulator